MPVIKITDDFDNFINCTDNQNEDTDTNYFFVIVFSHYITANSLSSLTNWNRKL